MEFTHKFFKKIMWRSSKVLVADELQLPPQEEHVSWLFFSPIEAHFYQRQHETCSSYAHKVLEIFKDEMKKRKTMHGNFFAVLHFPVRLSMIIFVYVKCVRF